MTTWEQGTVINRAGSLGTFNSRISPFNVDWKMTDRIDMSERLSLPTNDQYNTTLFQWGPLPFQVLPLNVHEVDHETESDWAKKEIVGAALYREWVGENDESFHFRGLLFPYRIGGVWALEAFEALRRGGVANLLVRGRGDILGWFICEKLHRAHTFLSTEGVGRQLAFETILQRVPTPEAATFISQLWTSVAGSK